jgi:hypothetical protein
MPADPGTEPAVGCHYQKSSFTPSLLRETASMALRRLSASELDFGNPRGVRNLIAHVQPEQSNRLTSISDPSRNQLLMIGETFDVPDAEALRPRIEKRAGTWCTFRYCSSDGAPVLLELLHLNNGTLLKRR